MLCSIEEKRIYQINFQAVPFASLRSLRSGFRYRSSLLTSLRWPLRALHIANRFKSEKFPFRLEPPPPFANIMFSHSGRLHSLSPPSLATLRLSARSFRYSVQLCNNTLLNKKCPSNSERHIFILKPTPGLEPSTCSLRGSCSTR